MELKYSIKNRYNNTIYVYDIEKRNDNHFEEDSFENNLANKKIYIIKPTEDNWYGWGYNPNYPSFIKLNKGEKYSGIIKFQFTIPIEVNPKQILYHFNIIISNYDINTIFDSQTKEIINNNLLQNIDVKFKI